MMMHSTTADHSETKRTPDTAGLILLPEPMAQAIFSPFAGKLSDRIEPRSLFRGHPRLPFKRQGSMKGSGLSDFVEKIERVEPYRGENERGIRRRADRPVCRGADVHGPAVIGQSNSDVVV